MKRLLPVLMGFALLLLSSTVGWSLPPCPESGGGGFWNDCFGTETATNEPNTKNSTKYCHMA